MDNPNRDKENVKLMASVSPAATLISKTLTNKTQAAFTNLEPDERMERLLTVVYKKIQQIHKKEGNIPLKKKCQQVVESLENLYTRAAVITEPNKEDDRGTGLADISSIRGNSRMMVNISNLSLHQGDLVYEELKESDDEDEDDENILEQAKTHRAAAPAAVAEKKGEFAFENMKPAEKEQFGKIVAMFKDIRTQDEHASEKLETITGFIEKANMEVVQACQGRIVKMLKKALMGNATDPRNMLRVFEAANNLLIKLNKICLEILPETLNTELKTILLLLSNVLNTKSIEKTLDAMYMTCSLENFLKVTLFLFEKVDTKYIGLIPEAKLANALRIYLNWLVLKVEKLQDVLFGESALKDVENGFSQFRFSNLPQVHLGLVNILSKKLKKVEQSMIAADQSMRSYETPRSSRRHMKNLSIDPHNTYGKDDIGGLNVSIRETNNFSNKLKNIQEQAKNDSRGGLEKFNSLLSSFKKKNMDRLNLSSSISPQVDSISPSGRHWKRGLGREGTPFGGDLGQSQNDSMRRSRALSSNKDKENKFFTSGTPGIDISDITTTLVNSCTHLSDKDLPIFETTLSKVRSMYQPKEMLQVVNSISQKLFLKGCFGSRVKAENILSLLHKNLEDLDKHAFFRTMKAFFCMKSRENDHETVHNITQGCLELALAFYRQTQFPHKLVSAFVEMIVYALTDLDLRPSAEEALELISKSIGRESLRKIFEIELIHSAKMYQIFLYWADQHQSFGNSPISKHEPREPSPVPRKDEIYVEQNETHVLHDDSFNNSFTPQRPTNNNKRNSHSFDQVLEQAANDQDMNQLSEILMHDEKDGEIIDGPNFGYNVRGTDTELSKGTLESRMGTIEKNLQHIDRNLGTIERNMGSLPSLTAFERQEIPSLSQFGDSVGPFVLNELGTAQKEPIHIQREEPPQFQMHPPQQNLRQVLGEKRFGEPQTLLQNIHTMNPIPQRNLVMPQHNQSEMFNKEDKENFNENLRGREEFQTRGNKRDDSAEKWKEKYLQEKTRLQGTIDLLEKANQGYFTQVTEKSDLVGKLNQQRQINEDLLNKFNMLSEENEKLKKETIAFEIERERASTHHSLMLNSTFFHNTNKMDVKKLRHQKFIQEALPIAAKGQGRNKEEFIKQFQEVLLTSDNLEYEMGETLMRIYEELEEYGEKVQFVVNLKTSVAHPQVMGNLSVQNHKFLLEIALKLCISVRIL